VLRNRISEEVVATEARPGGCHFEDIRPLVAGARGRKALEGGDPNGGIISAGLVIGLIDDVPTCQALVQRMVRECRERLALTLSCLG
jgi:nitronate monooxygenase